MSAVAPSSASLCGRAAGARPDLRARLALPVGLAVGAAVWLASLGPGALPGAGWAALFLAACVERDVRGRRIPNALTFPAFALALGHAALLGGLPGLGGAVLGAGVGLAFLFAPFAARVLGAGDVKAVMVLGAFWGAGAVASLVAWAVVLGAALGIAWLAAGRGLGDFASRWGRTLWTSATARRWVYFAPAPGSVATRGLPFAVALGAAAVAQQGTGFGWW